MHKNKNNKKKTKTKQNRLFRKVEVGKEQEAKGGF